MKQLTAFLPVFCLVVTGVATASPLSVSSLQRSDIERMIVDEAHRQSFPAEIALSVAKIESNYQPDVVSHKGAIGVMQIMPRTARNSFGLEPHELYDAETNIRTGIRYLKLLYREYGRMDIALSHYNGGSAVRHHSGELQIIPWTRHYVQRVLETARTMQREGRVAELSLGRRPFPGSRVPVGNIDDATPLRWRPPMDDFERGRFGSRWASKSYRGSDPDRRRSIYGSGRGDGVTWRESGRDPESAMRREQILGWESIYNR